MADFSVAATVNPPKVTDPLELIGKVNQAQQGLLNNKLLGQQVKGKIALGHAITDATDPNTGRTDWDKAAGGLAQDPDGAFQLPEFSAQAQARRLADMGLQTADLERASKKLGAVADWGLSMLAGGDPAALTKDAIVKSAKGALIDTGLLDLQNPQDAQQIGSFIGQLSDDPVKNKSAFMRLYAQTHPTVEGINLLLGTPTQVDMGPGVATVRTPTIGGPQTVAGVVDKGLSPGEAVAPNYSYTDDKGVPHIVTKGATAAAGTGGRPEGIVTGPAAGAIEAQTRQAADSQTQFAADTNDAGGFSQRMLGLTNAEKALSAAQTGKGGQALQDWRNLLGTLGVPLSEADKSKALNFDEAKKYLTDYANRRGAALGIGTDAGREMVHAANPNVDINKAAAQDILKVIRGMERMQNAQVAAATAAGVSPANYSTWRANWNRNIDPRGFMADQIPATTRAKDFDKMTKPDQARYARAVQAAVDAGYFSLGDLRK